MAGSAAFPAFRDSPLVLSGKDMNAKASPPAATTAKGVVVRMTVDVDRFNTHRRLSSDT